MQSEYFKLAAVHRHILLSVLSMCGSVSPRYGDVPAGRKEE